jgi:hypothetical protein
MLWRTSYLEWILYAVMCEMLINETIVAYNLQRLVSVCVCVCEVAYQLIRESL